MSGSTGLAVRVTGIDPAIKIAQAAFTNTTAATGRQIIDRPEAGQARRRPEPGRTTPGLKGRPLPGGNALHFHLAH